MVVERMKHSDNITALARELGLERKLMYTWKEQLENAGGASGKPAESSQATLERENALLKRTLAEKTLELDFFKGALQKVEARRRQSRNSGGKTSTTRSEK
jgi:transposase-like protein